MMVVSINERTAVKKLVVCGSDEVRYEMSASEMIEFNILSGGGSIDTSDHLNIFEGFQKVFIVNGGNLRVADFVNTKLTLAEFTTAPTRGSTITQANGTDATMIVDFVNAGKTAIYGYVTAGVFDCTRTISGGGLASAGSLVPAGINGMLTHAVLATVHTNGTEIEQATTGAKMTVEHTDATKTHTWGQITTGTFTADANQVTGDGTAFIPTATDTSPPVWHGWTVYPIIGETTYGTMPEKGYLGCLYHARCIISGNPNAPHQWYMSKIGDPWNWVYSSTDPLSAAAGQNADAGLSGDIIRALIPYKDDYLVFGCASTIYVLTGDPTHSGSIDRISSTVGMFGANSWCFDGEDNLYFWGTGGIYKIPLGFRSVENLTEVSLPNLVKEQVGDANVNPSSHRITMAYDRKRHGILICITKLSDGDNSNYWYDLRVKGFFPESYPDECGAYSLFYYAANDNDYADLLVGSKDGYIRKFSDAAAGKNDHAGASGDTLINSYAVWPIQHLTEDNDKKGKLTSLTIELAGGAADGTFGDTDGVTYELHVGDDAETVIEDIRDSADAFTSGTLTGTGRKARIRTKVRGAWLGLKLYNSTLAQSWSVNKIYGKTKDVGRIK